MIHEFTPISLTDDGEAWFVLGKGLNLKTKPNLMIAKWICLCFAMELYLKSYIVLKDKIYANNNNLKKLGHNFIQIENTISKLGTKQFSAQVKNKLKKYRLLDTCSDFTNLRYPLTGRMTSFDVILKSAVSDFEGLFQKIDLLVHKGYKKWEKQ